jgi:hypothetical protein
VKAKAETGIRDEALQVFRITPGKRPFGHAFWANYPDRAGGSITLRRHAELIAVNIGTETLLESEEPISGCCAEG